jgi:hypothetical protein
MGKSDAARHNPARLLRSTAAQEYGPSAGHTSMNLPYQCMNIAAQGISTAMSAYAGSGTVPVPGGDAISERLIYVENAICFDCNGRAEMQELERESQNGPPTKPMMHLAKQQKIACLVSTCL